MMNQRSSEFRLSRRSLLIAAAQLSVAALITLPLPTQGAAFKKHPLCFFHTHTEETLEIEFKPGSCSSRTLRRINHFLRDHRTGESHPIDLRLLETLCHIQRRTGSSGTIEVISGYRSPRTNAMLRQKSNGVAQKSLHLQGQALDVRITDLKTSRLRDIAKSLRRGGVGYYADANFVHLDTGRVRAW